MWSQFGHVIYPTDNARRPNDAKPAVDLAYPRHRASLTWQSCDHDGNTLDNGKPLVAPDGVPGAYLNT